MKERLVRERIFFFIMVIGLIIVAAVMLWPFLTSILFALAVVVIMKPIYNWFLDTRLANGDEKRAAGATVLLFILVIAVPIILIISAAVSQAASLFIGLDIESIDFSLESLVASIEASMQSVAGGGIQVDQEQITASVQEAIYSIAAWFGEMAIRLGESIPQFIVGALIVLVIMVVLLPRYKRPEKVDVMDIVPFPKEITQLYLDKINSMIIAMFKGTFIIAIVQGAVMGLVLWIAGVPYTMFFTLLSMILSLVPLIGISLVAWPVGIILILIGQVWQGIFVILAFILFIAHIDTFMRPRLVPKEAHLNPALVILSVFGGLQLMGLIGALYGPVIMILLVTSIEVYTKYMLRSDLEVLLNQDDLDLEELGLAPMDDEENGRDGIMTSLKTLAARFHYGPQAERPNAAADKEGREDHV